MSAPGSAKAGELCICGNREEAHDDNIDGFFASDGESCSGDCERFIPVSSIDALPELIAVAESLHAMFHGASLEDILGTIAKKPRATLYIVQAATAAIKKAGMLP
jgi:hypothetical protein